MIDMSKKYRTRDGRDVRLLCVDGFVRPGDRQPVIGIVTGDTGVTYWTPCGRWNLSAADTHYDLIEVAPDVVLWRRLYRDGSFGDHNPGTCPRYSESAVVVGQIAIQKTTIRNGGVNGPSDVTIEVLPVDYKETP